MNHQYTYIGAFAECQNPHVEKPLMTRRCANPECPTYHDEANTKYCGDCGRPTEECQSGANYAPTVNHWEIEINEKLFCAPLRNNRVDIWLPNKARSDANIEINEGYQAIDCAAELPGQHITHFEVAYAEALVKLIDAYGEDNVRVRWGIVTYSM